MAWVILFVAGLFEVCWAVGLKYSEGFTRLWPSVFTAITLALSMILLGWAVRTLPLGTAYTVWTGIGAIGTVILGIWLFNEPVTAVRIGCIALILAGIIGLKATAGTTAPTIPPADVEVTK
jgi:quaternary ammonium compound-resistance protein SugE